MLLEPAVLPRVVHLSIQVRLLLLRYEASEDTIRAARVYELTAKGVDAGRVGPWPRVELHKSGLCCFIWLSVRRCVESRLLVLSLLKYGLTEYVDFSSSS